MQVVFCGLQKQISDCSSQTVPNKVFQTSKILILGKLAVLPVRGHERIKPAGTYQKQITHKSCKIYGYPFIIMSIIFSFSLVYLQL
jgi:hypothetical protein